MRITRRASPAIQRMRGPATDDEDVPDNRRHDGKLCDMAIHTLRDLASRDEPFFLAVGMVRPHVPLVAPESYFEPYPTEAMQTPFVPPGDLDDVPSPAETQTNAEKAAAETARVRRLIRQRRF